MLIYRISAGIGNITDVVIPRTGEAVHFEPNDTVNFIYTMYSKIWNNSGTGITVLLGDFWPLITVVFGIIVLGGELQFLV